MERVTTAVTDLANLPSHEYRPFLRRVLKIPEDSSNDPEMVTAEVEVGYGNNPHIDLNVSVVAPLFVLYCLQACRIDPHMSAKYAEFSAQFDQHEEADEFPDWYARQKLRDMATPEKYAENPGILTDLHHHLLSNTPYPRHVERWSVLRELVHKRLDDGRKMYLFGTTETAKEQGHKILAWLQEALTIAEQPGEMRYAVNGYSVVVPETLRKSWADGLRGLIAEFENTQQHAAYAWGMLHRMWSHEELETAISYALKICEDRIAAVIQGNIKINQGLFEQAQAKLNDPALLSNPARDRDVITSWVVEGDDDHNHWFYEGYPGLGYRYHRSYKFHTMEVDAEWYVVMDEPRMADGNALVFAITGYNDPERIFDPHAGSQLRCPTCHAGFDFAHGHVDSWGYERGYRTMRINWHELTRVSIHDLREDYYNREGMFDNGEEDEGQDQPPFDLKEIDMDDNLMLVYDSVSEPEVVFCPMCGNAMIPEAHFDE